jgi:ATP phosphoribosyltransferase regulatory subunit HisZ
VNGEEPPKIAWDKLAVALPEKRAEQVAAVIAARPEPTSLPERPLSFAEVLTEIATWIDATDRILVRRGEKKALGDGRVQADLRRAARALHEDPILDALMMDAMTYDAREG